MQPSRKQLSGTEPFAERRERLGAFLKSKRARVAPGDFALPIHRRRRVAGLRREEVAMLAGISVTWYTQLESGAPITVSPSLLRRLSDVLRLSPIERAYLFALAIEDLEIVPNVLVDIEMLADARIACGSIDGEIAMALRTHRALKTQIYGALVHDAVDSLQPYLDEQRCPIGIWLHDDLAPLHRRSAHYDRTARIHAAFHREIAHVVDIAEADCATHVEALVAAPGGYSHTSAELEDAFSAWRSGETAFETAV